jgi:DNA-binding NarL/FixJ family response regulator
VGGGAGRAAPLDDTVRKAAAVLAGRPDPGSTASGAFSTPQPNRSMHPMLTRREREILSLLCQRRTDLEIAEHLFISPKTAGKHVSNILGKLGVANRREAAAVAVRHALL